ncbi:MAG: hypothetical protein HDS77_09335 [Bacteroidales bacterium]|nr:hypothetical protein [Bacteroidales bacterium]
MADKQWYELNPSRLELEKMAMFSLFPDFKFDDILDNSSFVSCKGTLSSETLDGSYEVLVFYVTNKLNRVLPHIYIAPINPSFQDLIPSSMPELEAKLISNIVLPDNNSLLVLNVNEDPADNNNVITAATLLKKAIGLFEIYEKEKKELDSRKDYDDAVLRRQKLREELKRGRAVQLKKSNNYTNEVNADSLLIKDNLIETGFDLIPEESNQDIHWSLSGMNNEFVMNIKKPILKKITFDRGVEIIVPNGYITASPVFEYCCKNVIKCWQVVSAYQKISSNLNYSMGHLLDPNLFLECFKKDMASALINGKLSKSIIRGTGLKTSFDQDFYVNVDDLRFPYCELEVFIAYTLKHLGYTFLNLSKAYKDYRFIYCREMLEDVIETSDYSANIINDSSDKIRVSPIDYMPYGLYCYKNNKDNSIHIIHYLWRAACDIPILGEHDIRGYYMREVTVRSKYKFDDEVSYSDLEFEYNDKLITKFEINTTI